MLPSTLKLLSNFGRSFYDSRAFMKLCSLNHIEVIISNDVTKGYYYFDGRTHTIALSAHLTTRERAFVAWHEFAHFLQNFHARRVTAAALGLSTCSDQASEKLADIFATIVLRPDEIRIAGPQDFLRMLMNPEGKYHV